MMDFSTRIWKFLAFFYLIGYFQAVGSIKRSVGIVHNVTVMPLNMTSTMINGSCTDCLCALIINESFYSSFNCFRNNDTCEVFPQSLDPGSFILTNNTPSSLYFFSQSIDDTRVTTQGMTSIITPQYVEYLWTFDSTYQDLSSTFHGTPVNGPRFNSSTITGYGSSLSFSSTASQAVVTSTPILKLSNHSWTFEVWIYLWSLVNSPELGIIGQCQSPNSVRVCLHMNIRQQRLYLAFFHDDLSGITTLVSSKWYHIAFVFNRDNLTQLIYLDGVLDGSRTANDFYHGNSGNLTFGFTTYSSSTACYFNGFIDQLYYTNRAKTPAEILNDATLTLYFSFDNGSAYDSGPLRINGSLVGSTSKVTGRVGDAIHFGSNVTSYFRVNGLVLLGTPNQSYSISIWAKPAIIRRSSIIHVSSQNDGFGWCIGFLGLESTGQLVALSFSGAVMFAFGPILLANSWTHAAITYSSLNGVRLYVNGTLRNSSTPFAYAASRSPNYLFLSSCLNGSMCAGMDGQFEGALDEFRLYSRELTVSDVYALSHP